MLSLMLLEIKSIYQERSAHDREQAEARAEQLREFRETASGIQESLRRMEYITGISKGALEASTSALNQITGRHQFCYLDGMPLNEAADERVALIVRNSGSLPLQKCHFEVWERLSPNTANANSFFPPASKLQVHIDYRHPIEEIEAGEVGPASIPSKQLNSHLSAGSYFIVITTRNDEFYETVTFKFSHHILVNRAIEVYDSNSKKLFSANDLNRGN